MKPRSWLVATDGSELSQYCFALAADELMAKRDVIDVLGVSDSTKTHLKPDWTEEGIRKHYTTECIGRFPRSRYQVVFKEKIGNSVAETLKTVALKHEADYLVVGAHGRKGAQGDKNRIGKTVASVVLETKSPLIVVKREYRRANNPTGGFNWLICIDGSRMADYVMQTAKDIARNKNDKVYACHIIGEYNVKSHEVEAKTMAYAKEIGLNIETFFQVPKGPEGIHQTLVGFSNEHELEFDFLIVGCKGCGADSSARYLSNKLLTQILAKTVLNTVVVPRPY